MINRSLLVALLLPLGVLAQPASITIVSGNGQVVRANFPAGQPLTVQVRDISGNPVPSATVNWAVTQGIGQLPSSQSTTDGNGIAQISFVAGSLFGSTSFSQSTVSASIGSIIANFIVTTYNVDFATGVAYVQAFLDFPTLSDLPLMGQTGQAGSRPIQVRIVATGGLQAGSGVPNAAISVSSTNLSSGPQIACLGTFAMTDATGTARCTPIYAGSGTGQFNINAASISTFGPFQFTVTGGSGCSYSINPSSQQFGNAGGSGSFTITTTSTCAWTVTNTAPWITVTNSSGVGTGSIAFTVAANTGAARSTTLTVGGQTFTVSQSAASGGGGTGPTAVSVTPSTGTGFNQTFSFAFSDTNGISDLAVTEAIFNSVRDAASACAISFNQASNSAFLINDAGTGATQIAFGSQGTVSNGQCTLSVSGAAFSGGGIFGGNTLTVSGINITFQQTFAGMKNIYLYAQGVGGLNSGLPALGNWTVPASANVAPTAVGVSPSSGVGSSTTFAFTWSDANGYADLVNPEAIINSTLTASHGCVLVLEPRGGVVSLVNDTATGYTTIRLGTLDITENGQCVVFGSGSSMSASGTTLTLNAAVAFKASFSGPQNIYLVASDVGGLSSGIQLRGAWNVPVFFNQAPTAVSVTPASGSGLTGAFLATFADPNGFADMVLPEVIINSFVDARISCTIAYDRFSNKLYLVNDSATGVTSLTPGTAAVIENGQCTLNGAGSTVALFGTTITLNLNVTFKPWFSGTKSVFLYARDVNGTATGFPQLATWTVPASTNQAPAAVAVTPSSGSGSSQVFRASFSDPNGYGDLVYPELLINATLDARNGCVILFDRLTNAGLLVNDAATATTPVVFGSAGSASNSQCTLVGAGSLVQAAGTTLTVQYNVVFAPGFAGPKSVYLYSRDTGGLTTGLQPLGTYTAQ